MKTILVVAAHPDDELLGCAGTVARHVLEGDRVCIAILAEGATSRALMRDEVAGRLEIQGLRAAASQAAEVLGIDTLKFYDLPDNRLDSLERLDVVKVVERIIEDCAPDVVYTHHVGDVNFDHEIVQRAVYTACRPFPSQRVAQILAFETVSSTEWMPPGSGKPFNPNWFVDITSTLPLKLKALEAYQSEMRPWPHSRSTNAVEHLARWRGASVGVEAAEAFVLLRNVRHEQRR